MRKLLCIFALCCIPAFAQADLFPSIDEMPGGRQHWVQTVLPVEKANGCNVYSATYAYFAKDAQPLFDIPRKNIYSVNIRFHECPELEDSAALYDKFAKVGDNDKKRHMSVGEKGLLYVVPDERNPLMGNYYLTSLMRNYVMQVHADDGFVLMDIAGAMSGRLERMLGIEGSLANGVTLLFAKDGYMNKSEYITFGGDNITFVDVSGTVFDEHDRRVPGVAVTIRENGNTVFTNKDGEYTLALSVAETGESITLFRSLTMKAADSFPIGSGYYKVDMDYKLQDKVSQNIWHLNVSPDGKVSGSTLNLSDNVRLNISGTITREGMELTRYAGSSMMGKAAQKFSFKFGDRGILGGEWSGVGGGGRLLLFTDSFDTKSVRLSMQEAGYSVAPGRVKSGKSREYIKITPLERAHDDFYTATAQLVLNVKAIVPKGKKDQTVNRALSLYKVNPDGSLAAVATSKPLPLSSKAVQASMDITSIYRYASAEYKLGLADGVEDNLDLQVDLSVELSLGSEKAKGLAQGAVTASLISLSGADRASSVKRAGGDGNPDIALQVDISAYGSILTDVSVRSLGESRQWDTDISSIYPGVAVLAGDAVQNSSDGGIEYPLQKMTETLTLYLSRGSTNIDKISGFEVILNLDGTKITVPVK